MSVNIQYFNLKTCLAVDKAAFFCVCLLVLFSVSAQASEVSASLEANHQLVDTVSVPLVEARLGTPVKWRSMTGAHVTSSRSFARQPALSQSRTVLAMAAPEVKTSVTPVRIEPISMTCVRITPLRSESEKESQVEAEFDLELGYPQVASVQFGLLIETRKNAGVLVVVSPGTSGVSVGAGWEEKTHLGLGLGSAKLGVTARVLYSWADSLVPVGLEEDSFFAGSEIELTRSLLHLSLGIYRQIDVDWNRGTWRLSVSAGVGF